MAVDDAKAGSFLDIERDSFFSLQNLPYGIFRTAGNRALRAGVAIGDYVLDLSVLEDTELLSIVPAGQRVFSEGSLNAFLALGRPGWRQPRGRVAAALFYHAPAVR